MNLLISIIKLFGGLALLIYGMSVLSINLKKIAGGRLEKILMSATDNIFKGLFTGIVITVITQSSSATTIIVVGLVNAEILRLKNAIPIIMGANIGTTITSQILRLTNLDSSSLIALFTPSSLAPIMLIIGLLIIEISKKKKSKDIGQMFLGVGLLFTGMIIMVDVASGFSELPVLKDILTTLSNPILGVIAGAIITAIVQSSSATVGILQALSTTGIMTYASTIPIILGQNIGTCVTSILASIGGAKNAKRAAAVHLYFNLIGTVIFLIGIYSYQFLVGFPFWEESIDMGGIANFHTLFNVVSTIILLPFAGWLEKLTIITIRDKKDKKDNTENEEDRDYYSVLNLLDERVANVPNIAILNSSNVIEKMGELSEKNFRKSMDLLNKFEMKKFDKIEERENAINKLEENVTSFLIKISNLELSDEENMKVTSLLKIESEFEKIGDYAFEFAEIVEHIYDKDINFSNEAYKDLEDVYKITEDTILNSISLFNDNNLELVPKIEALRDFGENQKEEYKMKHIKRLKEGKCTVEGGIAFLELISVCGKIIEHCCNVNFGIVP